MVVSSTKMSLQSGNDNEEQSCWELFGVFDIWAVFTISGTPIYNK